ncbi:MAG: 2-dehydropantoate 2-reductase [Verrucomicrobia bacterium]|nr:2-dehydropantoate 2-reductase [Verrucomicrobiota bacterium]
MTSKFKKIAIVGCGALGGFYGAKVAQTKPDVFCLLRSDYDAVRKNGIQVRSTQGDFTVHPRTARDPAEIGPSDLVVIGLKTTANHMFSNLITPLVKKETLILTLQNGLGNEEALADLFDPANILGGLCFVCLTRIAPGVITHTGHGKIVLGEYRRPPQPRTHMIADIFKQAGVECKITDNLEKAHWEKLVWNVPFNGLGVAGSAGFGSVDTGSLQSHSFHTIGLTTEDIINDPRWFDLAGRLMREIITIARAKGLDVKFEIEDELIDRTRVMGPYKASTIIDYEHGRPIELQSLFMEPLRQAQTLGIHAPHLSNLCKVLDAIVSRKDSTRSSALT